jgi:formate dehydrogenase major subunit
MNGERRVQRVRRAIEPVGEAKPDWEIVCLAAKAMGRAGGFDFTRPDEIWDEIRRVWPAGAGISPARLDASGGVQWPCPSEDHPGTQVLHIETFAALGPRTRLVAVEYRPTPERTDDAFPFVLVTGRTLEQFNAGTMTRRSLTQELQHTDVLELAPSDADALGVPDGDLVRVESRYGTATLPARRSARIAPGQCFTTFCDPERDVNRVTGPHRDAVTHTPEYKVTAVRLTPIAT